MCCCCGGRWQLFILFIWQPALYLATSSICAVPALQVLEESKCDTARHLTVSGGEVTKSICHDVVHHVAAHPTSTQRFTHWYCTLTCRLHSLGVVGGQRRPFLQALFSQSPRDFLQRIQQAATLLLHSATPGAQFANVPSKCSTRTRRPVVIMLKRTGIVLCRLADWGICDCG